jgi:3D (Asp-Asp-Asp) domain-containing protein
MKRLIIAVGLNFILLSAAFAAEQSLLARVTVYWRAEGCGERASWTGARLHDGHCAVDPRRIAYGSRVLFPDGPCLAVDTGPDVVNRKAARLTGRTTTQRNAIVIDRFFASKKDALDWSASHPQFLTVQIVSPGSNSKSAELSRMTNVIQTGKNRAPVLSDQTLDSAVAMSWPLNWFLRPVRRRT